MTYPRQTVYTFTIPATITLEIPADTLSDAQRAANAIHDMNPNAALYDAAGERIGTFAHVAIQRPTAATAGRTPQEAAAEVLAAALTSADVPAEHIGAGVIETWIDVTDGEHEGTLRLHVDEDGAEVTIATTYYDPADEDQPGRPVEDQEHGTFPLTSTDGILYCLRVLAEEHGAT